jgi:hypothetical protein
VLLRQIAIANDHQKARTLFGRKNDTDSLSHARNVAWFASRVNLVSASVH